MHQVNTGLGINMGIGGGGCLPGESTPESARKTGDGSSSRSSNSGNWNERLLPAEERQVESGIQGSACRPPDSRVRGGTGSDSRLMALGVDGC